MPDRAPIHRSTPPRRPAEHRPTSSQRGYGHRWQQASKGFLRAHPLCVSCQAQGRLVPATQVDHRQPHQGNMDMFWDPTNWQSLCAPCHSQKTAREDGGFGRV